MRTASFLRPDSTHSVPSAGVGKIDVHVFEPKLISQGGGGGGGGGTTTTTTMPIRGTVVTVHPWSVLGGGEHNTLGIARHITANNSINSINANAGGGGGGWRVITFALKSSGAVWGILSAHSHEVNQVVDVVDWANQKYGTKTEGEGEEATQQQHHHPVVLLGSSAGAPIAGTAMARLLKRGEGGEQQEHGEERKEEEQRREDSDEKKRLSISAYVAVGYTFGNFASLGFGRHFSGVMGKKKLSSSSQNNFLFGMMQASSSCSSSPMEEDPAAADAAIISSPPKLFIMGERDEFTSVAQLEKMTSKMRANGDQVVDVEVVANVGHFELESSSYDPIVAKMVLEWLDKVLQ